MGYALLVLLIAACGTPTPDPCEAAWTELDALHRAMSEVGPAEGPSRVDFVAACRALPPEVRPCASISHLLDHWETCHGALESMPESVRAQAVRSLDGAGGAN